MQRNKNNYWNLYVKNSEFDFYRDNIYSLDNRVNIGNRLRVNKDVLLDDRLCFKKGKWVHYSSAGAGSSGYIKIAKIQISGDYYNQGISMKVLQRGNATLGTLFIRFNNQNNNTPSLSMFTSEGQIVAYLHEVAGGTFDLYILKSESYDQIEIIDIDFGVYANSKSTIKWLDEFVSSVPSGSVECMGSYFIHSTNNKEGRIGIYKNHTQGVYMYGWTDGRIGFHDSINNKGVLYYHVDNGTGYLRPQQNTLPGTNGTLDLGSGSWRWKTVCAVNAFNTSDERYKENIEYVDTKRNDEARELHEFYKNDFKLATYNYIGQEHKEYGFIAQDFARSSIGENLVIDNEEGYMYSIGSYISSIAGALQYEIKLRDKQIEELMEKVSLLENSSNKE